MFIDEADVDFYEEDGYLAGVAAYFAQRGTMEVDRITIRRSIDTAIEKAVSSDPLAAAELLEYRRLMLDTATSLSLASGVPIEVI